MQVESVQSALPVNSCIVKPVTGGLLLNQSRIKCCKRSFKDSESHFSSKHLSLFHELEETPIFLQLSSTLLLFLISFFIKFSFHAYIIILCIHCMLTHSVSCYIGITHITVFPLNSFCSNLLLCVIINILCPCISPRA